MRRAALLASSAVLLAALGVAAQDGPTDNDLRAILKSLAEGGPAVGKSIAALDPLPVAQLERIHRLAAATSPAVRTAARLYIPPASWRFSEEKTIGDVRSTLAAYTALLGSKEGPPRGTVAAAVKQLMFRGGPMIVPDVVATFTGPVNDRILLTTGVLQVHGTAELTPLLTPLLAKGNPPTSYVHLVLSSIGDARAGVVVLERMAIDSNETLYALRTSSTIGGPDTLEAMDRMRRDDKMKPVIGSEELEARLRLRDPNLARTLIGRRDEPGMAHRITPALARLGDPAIVPVLVDMLKSPATDIKDRRMALTVLGLLGNREHAALIIEHLKDGQCFGAAADAIGEIGDPAAAPHLVRSIGEMMTGRYAVRTILKLRLENPAELADPILAILAEPEDHRKPFSAVVALAGRVGGIRIRDRLLELLMAPAPHRYDDFEIVAALRPHIDATYGRRLSRSTSPDAPREDPGTRSARLALRGALGDLKSRTQFVEECAGGKSGLRTREWTSPLLRYPGKAEDLIPLVVSTLEKHPDWMEGALFLVRQGMKQGEARVRRAIAGGEKFDWTQALEDLPAAIAWELGLEQLEQIADDEALERIGRSLPESSLEKLREVAIREASQVELQMAGRRRPPGRTRTGMSTFDAGSDSTALGLLAARGDFVLESLFRWVVRLRTRDEAPDFTQSMCAQALARSGATDLLDVYRRMLRGMPPTLRVLGIKCCALLGDRTVIPDLAVLLDDHERLAPPTRHDLSESHEPVFYRRVCDEAADAIERLSGEKFPAPRPERLAAIKKWLPKK